MGLSKTLIAVVNVPTKTVVYWKVVPDNESDDALDKVRAKYKSPRSFEPFAQDMKDTLWIEDDNYDYNAISILKGQTPQSIFKRMKWKVKSK